MSPDARGLEQANVPTRLDDLPLRFWVMAIATGVGAGLGAILMMKILRTVQHWAFSYGHGQFSAGVSHVSDQRLVLMLALGGLVTGVGLWCIRRFLGDTGGEPTEVVWTQSGRLSLIHTLLSGALSEITVGFGGSIGREAAPQRFGAAVASFLGVHLGLGHSHRYILIACGAGAGLAAVYNAPLAGALFATEIYLGTVSLPLILPALLTSAVATAVARLGLPALTAYHVPAMAHFNLSLLGFSVVLGPAIGLASAGYIELIGWANDHRPQYRLLWIVPLPVFIGLGIIAIRYPLLLGNGIDLAQFAFTGRGALSIFAILALLKPLVTSATLLSGASGGLFTPTMSFGAALGAFLGRAWTLCWPGPSDASYALIAAAAMMAAAMEAPMTGVVFVIELTGRGLDTIVPILIAVVGATLTARHLNLRSIYSARLGPDLPAQDERGHSRPSLPLS